MEKHDGSQQLKSAKPSDMRTITVRFKQVVPLNGGLVGLDEKGFLWRSKGDLGDAMWEQLRNPKMDVKADSHDGSFGAHKFGQRNRAPTTNTPMTQKLDLSKVKV